MEALQKESSVRVGYWHQQSLREEEMVGDFDRAVKRCLSLAVRESDCVS